MTLQQLKGSLWPPSIPQYTKLPEYKDLPAMDNEQHSPPQATAPTVHKVIMFCRITLATLCAIALIVFEVVDYRGRKIIETELGSITKNVATTLCHDLITIATLCVITLITFEVVDYQNKKLIETELGSIAKNVATSLGHDLVMALLEEFMRTNGMGVPRRFLSLIAGPLMSTG
ncbi:uncharacterized protein BKCO1_2600074 [Diplodia corticola]|uniref:Uncharacterized protein n=1 Tax=Diplodia corticola TaxID=236234 RepID=A0A1J9R088_9PEZI|nr:uncharacterized protein BKCO1_2600074 [Diplodia corticola]OJD34017.1 hypothetical protein BKCO1_2600074 [Diplodia corticola]